MSEVYHEQNFFYHEGHEEHEGKEDGFCFLQALHVLHGEKITYKYENSTATRYFS